ncbi:MAG: 4-hydroxy-tetrahydrodipicolinate synthase [Clostridiales bacterium]|nr:4-hydroxy-tetrahydrodipicolinate synthase [Clostridiales bacterium]
MKGFFKGSATAIITPFNESGVNYEEFGKLIEFQIENGTDAIVFLGTTGEPSTMSFEEEHVLMEYAVKKVNGRAKVIFGCGSNNTADAIMTAQKAESYGADGLLAVTPYYNKCTQNGLVAYYKAICESVSIPVIAYNVPGRTGVEIQPATMAKIADIPNIAGIKDAGGNMSKTMETLRLVREKCDVYSGEDALNFPILAVGGVGVISVLSNILPKEVKELCTLVKAGKLDEAAALNDKLLPVANACFVEVNPIPVKEAVNLIGFNVGEPRAPLTKIEDCNREKLIAAMKNYGMEIKA